MNISATNIGETQVIAWRGKEVKTGIFKYPTAQPIYLGTEDVKGDHVVDRRFHGGVNKACYLYSLDHYPYWKERFPELEWDHGMFGENLTVAGLDETTIQIGAVYKLGGALVQVTQPREPCYKLGVRFGTQTILKQFIATTFSGVYIRVLEPGTVSVGDTLTLQEAPEESVSISDVFSLHYHKTFHKSTIIKVLNNPWVAQHNKDVILKRFKDTL